MKTINQLFATVFREVNEASARIWGHGKRFGQFLMDNPIARIIAAAVTIVAGMIFFLVGVVALLVLGDPYQATEIVRAFSGVELFSYVTLGEYYGLVAGGVTMALAVLLACICVGSWLWMRRNYFASLGRAMLYIGLLFLLGAACFLASVFYVLPDLVVEYETYERMRDFERTEPWSQYRYYYYNNSW